MADQGLWYFAHPYTCKDVNGNYVPEGEEANFHLANIRAGELMKRGFNVYSPISHTHPIHRACPEFLARHEHDMWYVLDNEVIQQTNFKGIIVAPGWEHSTGILGEKAQFDAQGKPTLFYEDIIRTMKPMPSDAEWEAQRKQNEARIASRTG